MKKIILLGLLILLILGAAFIYSEPKKHIEPAESVYVNGSSVKYMSITESGLPQSEINNSKRDFDNLNKYGSYSGGAITHEFTKVDDFKVALQKNGSLQNILTKLSFVPTEIGVLLGSDFELIGADYSGTLNEGKFNSIFMYYEDNNKKKFEVNELYLIPDNNYSLNVYTESINFYLAGRPATLQNLKSSDNKEIFNIDFNVNRRVFSISAEGFNHSEFLRISKKIANSAQKK